MNANSTSLKSIAVFEALKGIAVLIGASAVVSLVHENAQSVVDEIVRNFHLNPASRYPRVFIDAVNSLNSTKLWLLAAGALIYASLRFVEAYGLWHELAWAEWFGAISGSIYLPIEVYELMRGVNAIKLILFLGNLFVVGLLVRAISLGRQAREMR